MDNNVKKFNKGEIIFNEGVLEDFMYDLIEGKVGIYAHYGKVDERLLTELHAAEGDVPFGEMGLIDMKPRSATAVALEDTVVYVISNDDFANFFGENPNVVLMIMQNISQRTREMTTEYLEACRAAAESVDSKKTGKKKSEWFMEKMKKLIHDYDEGLKLASQNEDYHYYFHTGLIARH